MTVKTIYNGDALTRLAGTNGAITGGSITVNTSGVSVNLPNYLTTAALSNHSHGNPTLNLTNITGTTASASNGLTLSLSGNAAQSVQTQNMIAVIGSGANGNGTFSSGTLSIKEGNNITLSTGANVLSIHGVAAQTTQTQNMVVVMGSGANGNGTFSSGTVSLKAGNNVTLSTGANVISVHGVAAQTEQTQNMVAVIGSGANGNGTFSSGSVSFKAGDNITLSTGANVISIYGPSPVGGGGAGVGETVGTTSGTDLAMTVDTNGVSIGYPKWITTARGSTDGLGLNTAGSNMTWTANSSGLSIDARGYGGTATTITTTAGTDPKITFNSAGFNVAFPAWLTTAQPTGNYLTTARASNDAVGLNTALTANGVAWTVNSSGLSLNVPAFLTTAALSNHSHGNPTLNLTNLSGTTNSASNGLTLSLSAAAPATISSYHNHPINILTTVGAPANNSATIMFLPMREAVSATKIELPLSANVATAANNSSGAILYTLSAYIYTKNGATLNTVSSGSGAATHTWSSNVTGSVTGGRFVSAAMNVNATAGNYFVGLHLSTRATGHAGPASTSLGNTLTMLGVGSAMAGAITFGDFNAATASSNGWYTVGLNSSTGNLTQVSLSNVTQAGTGFQSANIALRMYM